MNPQPWTCPDCGGHWIRNFVFDHDPTSCGLRNAEDGTQSADHERLDKAWGALAREATATELQLMEAITGEPPVAEAEYRAPYDAPATPAPLQTVVSRIAHGVHHRIIAGVDPDNINSMEA